MCVNTKTAIERAPEYSVAGVGEINPDPATELLSETDYIIKDVGIVEENNGQFCFFVSQSTTVCPIMHSPDPEDASADVTEGRCGLVEQIVTEVVMKSECSMGNSKSCAWLETGSVSAVAAMATGVLVGLIIAGCCCSSLIGGILHPKSRKVMKKHLNKAFFSSADADGDGMLDKGEVVAMFKKEFGEDVTEEEVDSLFRKYDVDGNGELDFDEYKKMMKEHKVNVNSTASAGVTEEKGIQLLSIETTL
ncbi:hypothetical protein TrRE_jg12286 [Triparma retinervis]|uniref:EF-hand domain-containing protein n=1 Tax=Triparma retinervis TaxID=2557542 RepID=A0A9W7A807_9STRA|nr:hypothetical protein TrRE_jg12286 [Triparma retinervis]